MKIIINLITFCVLWWFQTTIIILVLIGIGAIDTQRIGTLPGLVGILTIFSSYFLLKKIHKTRLFVKNFKSK